MQRCSTQAITTSFFTAGTRATLSRRCVRCSCLPGGKHQFAFDCIAQQTPPLPTHPQVHWYGVVVEDLGAFSPSKFQLQQHEAGLNRWAGDSKCKRRKWHGACLDAGRRLARGACQL